MDMLLDHLDRKFGEMGARVRVRPRGLVRRDMSTGPRRAGFETHLGHACCVIELLFGEPDRALKPHCVPMQLTGRPSAIETGRSASPFAESGAFATHIVSAAGPPRYGFQT